MKILQNKYLLKLNNISNNDGIIKVSIIVIVNDETLFNECLSFLRKQTISDNVELIPVDNRDNEFYNASSALNYGVSISSGDMLFFMHQDMMLTDRSTLEKYLLFMYDHRLSVVGLAGTEPNISGTVTDICIGRESKIHTGHYAFNHILEADTLDECFFAISRELFEKIRFNEQVCDDWHLYAPYLCIENRLLGNKNYIIPSEGWHKSDALSMSYKFYTTLLHMIKRYKGKNIPLINTTCVFMEINKLSSLKCYKSILMSWKNYGK